MAQFLATRDRLQGMKSGGPTTTCGAGVSPASAAGTAAPQNSKVILGQQQK
jgi:hypothetical protein